MKRLALIGIAWLSLVSVASALTLEWDRNVEPDMKEYQIYACWTAGCTVQKNLACKVTSAVIPQTVAGVKPSWAIPIGKSGAIAVTALDLSGNESPISLPLIVDQTPPGIVTNVTIKELHITITQPTAP